MLKVYRRDVDTVNRCPNEKLRFVVADGVSARDAEFDQARLECEAPTAEPSPNAEKANGAPNAAAD
jgi:hypothetical protein